MQPGVTLRGAGPEATIIDAEGLGRGIFVEDPKIGRVKVSWDAFERVEFRDPGPSGRGYDDYAPARRLTGTVTDYDDRTYKGELAFDLDETESFEMLNGDLDDVESVSRIVKRLLDALAEPLQVDGDEIFDVDCDVFAPCAIGAVLGEQTN